MKLTAEGIAVVEGDTYLSQEIIDKGRLDVGRGFLEQFRQYIPVGGVVIDVGASLGDYTATFLDMVGKDGIVFAFEPNPPVFECLAYNLRNAPNVELYNRALGSFDELHATVIPDVNNIGASRLERDEAGDVQCWVLDSFESELSRLDFLKIDAEGWEPLILDGAKRTISRFRPVMLIEVNTWPLAKMNFAAEDVFSRLDALNYSFDRFNGPYADILCLPKERT